MANFAKITRTITTKEVTVKGFNTTNSEVIEHPFIVDSRLKTNDDYLKFIRKNYDLRDFVPALVIAEKVQTSVYGMSEADFIANATIIKTL